MGFLARRILVLGVVAGAFCYGVEINNYNEAVNIAGKQRMFTQRMLKDYAMVGMGNTFGKPEEDLNKTIAQFDDAEVSLMKFAKSEDTKKAIEKVDKLWSELKKELEAKPSKDKVQDLQIKLDELLKDANEATMAFVKESGNSSSEIVNIAGRQRMLSQRMAGLYMLQVWGVEDPQFKEKLKDAMDLFSTSLEKLDKYENNTEDIKKILSKVKRSFRFFEMMSKSTQRFIPTLIYKKSNDILQDMNEATIKYTQLKTK
jgi:nitrate/nitrite-specific signal transduction histidine kinase